RETRSMHSHDFILTLIAFFSEFVGTLSGFGSSTFFVPAGLFFEKLQLILALTSILHCFGNVFRLIIFRRKVEWKLLLRLALPFAFFTGIGAFLTFVVSGDWIMKSLGFILILLGL